MSNIIDFKNYKKVNNDNVDFINALNILSKQNGINYINLILGSNTEKKIEKEKYDKKMEVARNKIKLMEEY